VGKLINSISLMSGILLLFYFGGLLSGTITSTLLNMALHPETLQTSSLVLKIISLTTVVLAIVSMVVARNQNSDFYLMIPLVILFLSFGWDFLVVYQQISSYSDVGAVLAVLIFGPLMIMYVISVVEWWRGVET
jgi:Ca2+/Na+ antiporter